MRAGAYTQVRDRDGLTPLEMAERMLEHRWMLLEHPWMLHERPWDLEAKAPHDDFFRAVARELRWTPAVRLLWLGQRSGGDSVLAKLDRDTLLIVCHFVVDGDVDPDQVDPDFGSDSDEFDSDGEVVLRGAPSSSRRHSDGRIVLRGAPLPEWLNTTWMIPE